MAKDYYDIISRPTSTDRLGKAFIDSADKIQPLNNAQRQEANLLRGFGTGLGMSQDQVREGKLAEMEGYSKQLAEMELKTQMQAGESSQRKATLTNWADKRYMDIKAVNDSLQKGNYDYVNHAVPMLLEDLFKVAPEVKQELGDYVRTEGDEVFFRNPSTGRTKSMFINELFEPAIRTYEPDRQQELNNLTSLTTYESFEANKKLRDLAIREKEANIGLHESQTAENYAKARGEGNSLKTRKEELEIKKLEEELNPSSGFSKKSTEDIVLSTKNWANEEKEKVLRADREINAYSEIFNLLRDEKSDFWSRSGTGMISAAQRFLDVNGTESSRRQAEIEMRTGVLYERLKDTFKGATSDRDIALFMTTLPKLGNDPKANENIIKDRLAELKNVKNDYKFRKQAVEELNYRLPESHSIVDKRVEELKKEDNFKRINDFKAGKIKELKVKTPTGQIIISSPSTIDNDLISGEVVDE